MPRKTWADGHWLGSCLHLAAREHQPSRGPTALAGGIPEAQGSGRLGPGTWNPVDATGTLWMNWGKYVDTC